MPKIGGGEVSSELSISMEFTVGETLEDTRQTEVSTPVRTPARHRAIVKTMARRSSQDGNPVYHDFESKGFQRESHVDWNL